MEGRRMRHAFSCALLVAFAVACSTASAVMPRTDTTTDTSDASVVATTLTTIADATGVDAGSLPVDEIPEAAVFLAAVDQAVQGTEYEGESFAEPEAFLGTGVLFCELLERDLSVEEILTAYLLALSPSEGAASEDDLILGGAILGAGIETLCPEFGEALEAITQ
jgi:hypothetical protein